MISQHASNLSRSWKGWCCVRKTWLTAQLFPTVIHRVVTVQAALSQDAYDIACVSMPSGVPSKPFNLRVRVTHELLRPRRARLVTSDVLQLVDYVLHCTMCLLCTMSCIWAIAIDEQWFASCKQVFSWPRTIVSNVQQEQEQLHSVFTLHSTAIHSTSLIGYSLVYHFKGLFDCTSTARCSWAPWVIYVSIWVIISSLFVNGLTE